MYSENDPDNENQSDDEEQFASAACDLREKYNIMMNKYQMLLMKESMVSGRNALVFDSRFHFSYFFFFAFMKLKFSFILIIMSNLIL